MDPVYNIYNSLEETKDRLPIDIFTRYKTSKDLFEQLLEVHQSKLDRDFRQKMKTHFNGVFWEVCLAKFFTQENVVLSERRENQPDFTISKVQEENNHVFVEAVSVKSGDGYNNAQIDYPTEPFIGDYDATKPILRLTQGIREKSEKFKEYLEKKICKRNDTLIIAIHFSNDMSFDTGFNPNANVFLESVFPIGCLQIFETGRIQTAIRHTVIKHNGSSVETNFFFSPESSHISGLLYSTITWVKLDEKLDIKLNFIHNPCASNPLPQGFFKNLTEEFIGHW